MRMFEQSTIDNQAWMHISHGTPAAVDNIRRLPDGTPAAVGRPSDAPPCIDELGLPAVQHAGREGEHRDDTLHVPDYAQGHLWIGQ